MSDNRTEWLVLQVNAKDDQIATLRKEAEALRRERDEAERRAKDATRIAMEESAKLQRARVALEEIATVHSDIPTIPTPASWRMAVARKALADLDEGGDDGPKSD